MDATRYRDAGVINKEEINSFDLYTSSPPAAENDMFTKISENTREKTSGFIKKTDVTSLAERLLAADQKGILA